VLLLEMAGGSGFGDPRKRDRDLVRTDVENGYVSPEAAADIYGVDVAAVPPEINARTKTES
jgi:N-methylhydantoinase B